MPVNLQSLLGASAAASLLRSNASSTGTAMSSNAVSASLTQAGLGTASAGVLESAPVRIAKAHFTTPFSTPPWLDSSGKPAANSSLSAIKALKSLVDTKTDSGLHPDLREAFTTYRALDRMRVVAEAASNGRIAKSEREALDGVLSKGLADLRKFLGTISPEKLNIYFEAPSRSATSSPIRQGASVTSTFLKAIASSRTETLEGLSGTQSINLTIRRGNVVFPVNADLTQISGPLTLDALARALNAAISANCETDSNGVPILDSAGKTISRLATKFAVTNTNGKWGLTLQSVPNEIVWSNPPQSAESLLVIGAQSNGKGVQPIQIRRIDDFATQTRPRVAGSVTAVDTDATVRARLGNLKAPDVAATVDIASAVTDPEGNTYLLGTTAGAVDSISAPEVPEIFIRKISASGAMLWQRPIANPLSAQGAALSMGQDGNLVVAGSLKGGSKELQATDANIFSARFNLDGVELSRATLVLPGDQRATAVAADASGHTLVTTRNGPTGSGIYKFDANGKLLASIATPNSRMSAVQMTSDGSVLVLGRGSDGASFVERLDGNLAATGSKLDLGDLQPADMAISDDGTIAVSGTVFKPGTADKDAVISLIDSDLSGEQRIELATSGTEDADSLIYANNAFYLAGRTSGALDGNKIGLIDGFISKIDPQSGSVVETLQFGKPESTNGPVVVAKTLASSAALEKLGLGTGLLSPVRDSKLVDTTRLRAGDSFQVKLDGAKVQTIKIEQADTLPILAERIRKALGKAVTVATTNGPAGMVLRIQPTTGHALQLIEGPAASDALGKLGLKATRLFAVPPPSAKDPKVTPGGQYGLALSDSLSLATQDDAKAALTQIKAALSMTQTAYRSLYWNDSMVAKVEGTTAINSTQSEQLRQYRAAIARLGG